MSSHRLQCLLLLTAVSVTIEAAIRSKPLTGTYLIEQHQRGLYIEPKDGTIAFVTRPSRSWRLIEYHNGQFVLEDSNSGLALTRVGESAVALQPREDFRDSKQRFFLYGSGSVITASNPVMSLQATDDSLKLTTWTGHVNQNFQFIKIKKESFWGDDDDLEHEAPVKKPEAEEQARPRSAPAAQDDDNLC